MPKLPSLQSQCKQIGWPLEVMYAKYLGGRRWDNGVGAGVNPEEIVALSLATEGRQCSWCEGGSFNLLMKAAALDALAKRNYFNDRSDAVCRYFEAQCVILKDFEREITDCIRNVSRDRLIENIAEICSDPFIHQEAYPRVRYEFLVALSRAVERETIAQVASLFFKNAGYRAGWPDLTIVDGGRVSFVEVKTTDRFHQSQLCFADDIAKPLRFSCSVIQLRPAT